MFAGWMPHAEEVLSAAKPWRAGGEYPRYPMAAARRCPERSGHPLPAIEARPPSDQQERPRQKVAVPLAVSPCPAYYGLDVAEREGPAALCRIKEGGAMQREMAFRGLSGTLGAWPAALGPINDRPGGTIHRWAIDRGLTRRILGIRRAGGRRRLAGGARVALAAVFCPLLTVKPRCAVYACVASQCSRSDRRSDGFKRNRTESKQGALGKGRLYPNRRFRAPLRRGPGELAGRDACDARTGPGLRRR